MAAGSGGAAAGADGLGLSVFDLAFVGPPRRSGLSGNGKPLPFLAAFDFLRVTRGLTVFFSTAGLSAAMGCTTFAASISGIGFSGDGDCLDIQGADVGGCGIIAGRVAIGGVDGLERRSAAVDQRGTLLDEAGFAPSLGSMIEPEASGSPTG